MSIFDNINGAVTAVSKKAAKAYGFKRLDMKIKAYEKELDALYKKAGRLFYISWSTDCDTSGNRMEEYMESIRNIHFRINRLSKELDEIKNNTGNMDGENSDVTPYAKLAKKANDLQMSRTADGIRLVRRCKACSSTNSPKAEVCEGCGVELK